MSEDLDQLHAGISHVQIRPDQDVSPAGYAAFSLYLLFRYLQNDGGIQLKFTVQVQVRPFFPGDLQGISDLFDQNTLSAASVE